MLNNYDVKIAHPFTVDTARLKLCNYKKEEEKKNRMMLKVFHGQRESCVSVNA